MKLPKSNVAACILIASLIYFPYFLFAQNKEHVKGLKLTRYKFIDKTGTNVSISDLKGKYVFLDIWASWCRPCINKFPAYDSLKLALRNNNIVCLQVSIDAQERRWRDGMGFHKRIIDQWYSLDRSEFMKTLDISHIPRYILIDRKGKILDPDVKWKDTGQLIVFISKLNGI